MELSIIIVNRNTKALLLECLKSINQTIEGIKYEIWLVDNASEDDSILAAKEKNPDIHIIKNKRNMGFAAANNRAIKRMKGRYALLLNTDARLTEGAVKALYDFMEMTGEAGMAGGQLLNPDGSKQNSIANFPSLLSLLTNETLLRIIFPAKYPSKRNEYHLPLEVESCIGACLIVRKSAIDQVGCFDERYFFYFEETDWAYRMKRTGWKVFFVPAAKIYHAQGRTVGYGVEGRIMFYRSRYTFFKKWRPHMFFIIHSFIFVRLLANAFFSSFGAFFTFGLHRNLRMKSVNYVRLIHWHLRGCP